MDLVGCWGRGGGWMCVEEGLLGEGGGETVV